MNPSWAGSKRFSGITLFTLHGILTLTVGPHYGNIPNDQLLKHHNFDHPPAVSSIMLTYILHITVKMYMYYVVQKKMVKKTGHRYIFVQQKWSYLGTNTVQQKNSTSIKINADIIETKVKTWIWMLYSALSMSPKLHADGVQQKLPQTGHRR